MTTHDETLQRLGEAVHDCVAAECTEEEIADTIATAGVEARSLQAAAWASLAEVTG